MPCTMTPQYLTITCNSSYTVCLVSEIFFSREQYNSDYYLIQERLHSLPEKLHQDVMVTAMQVM